MDNQNNPFGQGIVPAEQTQTVFERFQHLTVEQREQEVAQQRWMQHLNPLPYANNSMAFTEDAQHNYPDPTAIMPWAPETDGMAMQLELPQFDPYAQHGQAYMPQGELQPAFQPQAQEYHTNSQQARTQSLDSNNHAGPSNVPQPPHNATSSKVPISRASSVPQTQAATGPMSKSVTVPARPKPGRKPIQTDNTADRRRQQNRQAQRNFRDKRTQKQHELEEELRDRKKSFEGETGELRRTVAELQQRMRFLEAQLKQREDELRQLQAANSRGVSNRLTMPSSLNFQGPNNQITPPDEQQSPFGQTEQDFTNMFSRRIRPDGTSYRHQHHDSGAGMLDFGRCGFCKDPQNCACEQTHAQPLQQPQFGNCADCQKDPERARRCREFAVNTEAGSAAPDVTMSCADFIDQAQERGIHQPATLFQEAPQVYAGTNGGFVLDEQQAAEALQTLSTQPRRNTAN